MSDHAILVRDLRSLADWLEAHPEVPPPTSVRAQISILRSFGTTDERLAELARIVGVMGVQVELRDDGLSATRNFGTAQLVAYTSIDSKPADTNTPPDDGRQP